MSKITSNKAGPPPRNTTKTASSEIEEIEQRISDQKLFAKMTSICIEACLFTGDNREAYLLSLERIAEII